MLYIVGTPIGNLEDLSIRQAKTLNASEYILTEDTRTTGILLKKIKELFPSLPDRPSPQLISYYKDNEMEKLPEIMELIESGAEVSLISQAGMPLVSDPGYLLMRQMIKNDIDFDVIPGPTAITTALLHSGFNPQHHAFVGFMPRKPNDIKRLVDSMKVMSEQMDDLVFVAYESPNRVNDTLKVLAEAIPEANVVVTREMTKKFEEIIRGKSAELAEKDFKGEITLVIKLS